MLTRRVRIQVLLFVVIAALGVSWVGVRYVGLERYVHNTGYQARLDLPEAGGLFTNAEVTYRGVPVGRVHSLHLTDTGVQATLAINGDAPPIPADVTAVVAVRSVIGEQYVDLRPDSDRGPYLRQGSVLTAGEQDLPPSVDVLLRDSRDFAASVPLGDLRTVVNELYLATRGASDPLRKLITTSADLASTAQSNLPATQQLIQSSSTVLATQEDSAASIRAFSRNLRVLSATFKSSDKDFQRLLTVAPDAAEQLQAVFVQVGQPLGVVLSNLISTAQVFGTNAEGVRSILVRVPHVIDEGYAVTGPGGLEGTLVTDLFNPLPCTAGYGSTTMRPGLDTSAGAPLSTKIGCTASPSSGAPSSGAPSSGAPSSGTPSSGTPSSGTTTSDVTVTTPTDLAGLLGGH